VSQVASDAKALVGDELASLLAGLLEGLRAGGDEGMKAAYGLAGAVCQCLGRTASVRRCLCPPIPTARLACCLCGHFGVCVWG
jgi:hypothetical protein